MTPIKPAQWQRGVTPTGPLPPSKNRRWGMGVGWLMGLFMVVGGGIVGEPVGKPVGEAVGKPVGEPLAVVERVVDGDTLRVVMNGERELVRLIGVDTPESKPNEKAKRDAKRQGVSLKAVLRSGVLATQFTQRQVKPGDTVRLEYDRQQRDRYHRVLAYVYTPNGQMLNATLLKGGVATPMSIPPNTRYRAWFESLRQP